MARTPTSTTTEAGFTLVELLVVLALLAMAYGLAVPALNRVIGAGDQQVAVRELAAALRQARSDAVVGAREVRFVIDTGAGVYGADPAVRPLPRGIAIVAAVPATHRLSPRLAAIDFFPDGASTGGRITLSTSGGGSADVAVDWLSGRVGPP